MVLIDLIEERQLSRVGWRWHNVQHEGGSKELVRWASENGAAMSFADSCVFRKILIAPQVKKPTGAHEIFEHKSTQEV